MLVRADPYVRCDVDGVSKRTTVIKKSQNPRWETLLHLLVPHHDARIRVKVVDDQVLGINDKLGEFRVLGEAFDRAASFGTERATRIED